MLILAVLGIVFNFVISSSIDIHSPSRRPGTQEIQALSTAAQSCIEDNGPFPANLDNRAFLTDLLGGGTSHGRAYLTIDDRWRSPDGLIIDEWGTPLRISAVSGATPGVRIISAGPDKTFGTADDISND